jgi:RNA polymerase sigma-70 factor (ECF subfamily)
MDKGDAVAWEEFVRRVRPVIARTVLRAARRFGEASPQLMDDLVQETYLKICANDCRVLREFRPKSVESIFGLFKPVAYSVVHDHFRCHLARKRGGGRCESVFDDYAEDVVANREGWPAVERGILLGQIDDCLASVAVGGTAARDRRIFWLYYRHGMTPRAISAIARLGLTPKGVESVLHRLTVLVRRHIHQTTGRDSDP